jgi:hypothetical protein
MLIDDFTETSKLNEAIDQILSELVTTSVTDDSYSKLADQLTKLTKIKQIIVETRLKDFDAEEKAHEFRQSLELKNREHDLKKLEHDNALEMKARELQFKQEEADDSHALRKREIDLKLAEFEKPDRVSKDALVAAGASVVGILVIVGYERFNVIASKALSFVLKR